MQQFISLSQAEASYWHDFFTSQKYPDICDVILGPRLPLTEVLSDVWQGLTESRSWTMQCRISMYWYSSQQPSTVVNSGFGRSCHPAEGRPPLSHPGPLSFHHERCDDTPRQSMSLSCRDKQAEEATLKQVGET